MILLGLIAVLTGIGALAVWKTGLLDTMITRQLVIMNETKVFDMWSRPPVRPIHKIYLFNYTNVEEFTNGIAQRLKVQEIGPYVYRQTIEKINVAFHENDTVSFQVRRRFHFIPELSEGNLDDIIMAPNLALLSAVNQVATQNYFVRLALSGVVSGLGVGPFQPLKVGEFLWGYEDTLFDMSKTILSFQKELPFDQIGLMAGKNGTQRERMSVYTGVTDISMLDVVASYDGLTELDVWDGEECNKIGGSEGTMFPPPSVQAKQNLAIYSPELCRTLPMEFEVPVKVHELPAMRFTPPESIFSPHYANNSCFCEPSECPPAGVFDASKCTFGGPVLISFPHFYLGSPELQENVDGLAPNKDQHQFYLDIHERFGVILGGASRMQVNMLARHSPTFPAMSIFKEDTILPISWFEVSVDDLPQEIKDDLQLATHTATHGLLYFLLVSFVISSSLLTYCSTRRTRISLKHYDCVLVPPVSADGKIQIN